MIYLLLYLSIQDNRFGFVHEEPCFISPFAGFGTSKHPADPNQKWFRVIVQLVLRQSRWRPILVDDVGDTWCQPS